MNTNLTVTSPKKSRQSVFSPDNVIIVPVCLGQGVGGRGEVRWQGVDWRGGSRVAGSGRYGGGRAARSGREWGGILHKISS